MISEDGLLQANVTIIAGVLIFITISSVIPLGVSVLTTSYFASLIIVPFAFSAIQILFIKPDDAKATSKLNYAKKSTIAGFILLILIVNILGFYTIISVNTPSLSSQIGSSFTFMVSFKAFYFNKVIIISLRWYQLF